MTENQLNELLGAIAYAKTIPYHLLTAKDKAAILLSLDVAWWMTQKMNGDFVMRESDKKLIAEGKVPSDDEVRTFYRQFFG